METQEVYAYLSKGPLMMTMLCIWSWSFVKAMSSSTPSLPNDIIWSKRLQSWHIPLWKSSKHATTMELCTKTSSKRISCLLIRMTIYQLIKGHQLWAIHIFLPRVEILWGGRIPIYLASKVWEKNYRPKVDNWRARVTMYVLLCKQYPFRSKNEYGII